MNSNDPYNDFMQRLLALRDKLQAQDGVPTEADKAEFEELWAIVQPVFEVVRAFVEQLAEEITSALQPILEALAPIVVEWDRAGRPRFEYTSSPLFSGPLDGLPIHDTRGQVSPQMHHYLDQLQGRYPRRGR